MIKRIIIVILIMAFVAIFFYLQNNWIGTTKLELTFSKLPEKFDGFKILHLSDLHNKLFGKEQGPLVEKLEKAKPNIIVITGDLISGTRYNEEIAMELVNQAVKIAPVYYVTGNHEWGSWKFDSLEKKLKAAGVNVLRNSWTEIVSGGQKICLAGIDDPAYTFSSADDTAFVQGKLQELVPTLPEGDFTILLSHRPEKFSLYSGAGMDLVFCGHAHGGQIRLPLLGGLYAPDQGFLPKYTSGVYRDRNSVMVVSRGLGNSIFPVRIFNRPEVVEVTLRSSGTNSGTATEIQAGEKQAVSLVHQDGKTILERFQVPDGFERVKTVPGSFEAYLQNLPLKPSGAKVMYYDGNVKLHEVYEAVIDMDVGNQDLQQCADAVIRLRSEYLYGKGLFDRIHFNFTNGFRADYAKWRQGYRIKVEGNRAYWVKQTGASKDYTSFRKYLDMVFAYAGTLSLSKEMKQIPLEEMQIGDVFLKGASPGHCVIVVDMAENKSTGEKRFMVAQSYMPAQDIHILKNPANEAGNPWYTLDFGETLTTPEWTFSKDQMVRFE